MRTLIVLCAVVLFASATRMSNGGKLCTFCESFVGGIEQFLEAEEKDIEGAANLLCDKLTKDNKMLDPICQGLIDNELENIIDWIEKNEKPEHVCTLLHLC